jgi:hypothetical protein
MTTSSTPIASPIFSVIVYDLVQAIEQSVPVATIVLGLAAFLAVRVGISAPLAASRPPRLRSGLVAPAVKRTMITQNVSIKSAPRGSSQGLAGPYRTIDRHAAVIDRWAIAAGQADAYRRGRHPGHR